MRAARAFATFWTGLEVWVTGLMVGGALALVLYTVVLRWFAPEYAPHITEELTVYIVMWAVLLAVGRVTRERRHIRADLVVTLLPRVVQTGLEILANVIGVAFAVFLARYGYAVAFEAWDFGDVSATALRFPLWIYYAALPVSAALIAIGHVAAVVGILAGWKAPNDMAEEDPV
ncbi:tripartite ATP-independent periplasmic transporter DctQ [Stappia sp. 22II-S9-Z10]|nr:tripartite ATP-independent periplasmic transporter DctQ [Stappia sp. 22II-S9-Z10]